MDILINSKDIRTLTKDTLIVRIKADDQLYVFNEADSAYMYLIVGERAALLFDAGFGFAKLKPLIAEVTDLPLTVVCSHGHDDHVLGCYQFQEAYIAEEDLNLCLSNDNPEQREKQIIARSLKTPEIEELIDRKEYFSQSLEGCHFKMLHDGDTFDLGGLTLITYPIPGHTKGSVGLYCPERKWMFTGDTVMLNHRLVYGQSLEISSAPQDFIRALTRLSELDIETVFPGHGDVPGDKSLITDTREMLIDWAHNGDIERDSKNFTRNPKSPFGKPGQKNGIYSYKNLTMSYNPGHLTQIRDFMEEHNGAVE